MKWFLSVCALAGLAAVLSSSCGPQKAFCPSNPPDYSCFDKDGGGLGGMGGQDQGPCDGASVVICQNGAHVCKQSDCP
jgi:hypothetical protein